MSLIRRLFPLALALGALVAVPVGAGAASLKVGIAPAGYASADPAGFWSGVQTLYKGKKQKPVVRIDIPWSDVAFARPKDPRNPDDPAYNWAIIDAAVSGATANKAEMLATVFWTPAWATKSGSRTAVPKATDFANFLAAAQTRYSGFGQPLITDWELWNEANNRFFLAAPGGNRTAKLNNLIKGYAPMLVAGRAALRSTAQQLGLPTPKVIAGAVGGQAGFGHTNFYKALSETKQCKGAKSRSCFDAISVHPYSPNPKVDPLGAQVAMPWATVANFPTFLRTVARYWAPRRVPVWVTELAWQTNPPDKRFGVPPSRQASLLKTAVRDFRKDGNVPVMIWFLMNDEGDVGNWQSGLRTVVGKDKPSWSAFRSVIK